MDRVSSGSGREQDTFREVHGGGAGSAGLDHDEPPAQTLQNALGAAQRGPGRPSPYPDLFARLRANCEVNEFTLCWEWRGFRDRYGYPKVTLRVNGKPTGVFAHRLMLELAHGWHFPFDESGHLCCNPGCINPAHLEIQTMAFNLSERRGYSPVKGKARMIPVLFPIEGWKPNPIIEAILHPEQTCPF
jgi:hypothetical protein